jgi:hypothetical protein
MSIMRQNTRQRLVFAAVLLPLLIFCAEAFCQSAGSLSGTVLDASQAVLPGATITATNAETGVTVKASTNSAGVYAFPSLMLGVYKVSAEMPGFQTSTKTDVKLGAQQARLNFELSVAGVATQIEITTSAQDMLLESGSSTGTVFQDKTLVELPLVNNDVMDLVNVMGGVVKPEDPLFGNSTSTFAGVEGGNVNVQRDGVTINEVRYASGISAASRLNPEMVGEFKLVVSSVDAELGRGGGQVQVITKSGANAFHGSAVWDVQNTALDANEWSNNRIGQVPNWRNLNEYTVTVNGPIRKNKTFFFAMWNQAIPRTRTVINARTLTPCARKGIYRYFDGFNNGNTQQAPTYNTTPTGTTAIIPVVNPDGTPKTPQYAPYAPIVNGVQQFTPYTGQTTVRYYSVLGKLSSSALSQIAADPNNCSQYLPNGLSVAGDNGIIAGTNWDVYRTAFDKSGFGERFIKIMPLPNDYTTGDGLNVANLRWVRTNYGADNVYGIGQDNARKQLTVKIDHNISVNHRLSGSLMYERDISETDEKTWPENSFAGASTRFPLQISSSLTSTLRPTLLNEVRFGFSRSLTHTVDPMNNPSTGQEALAMLDSLLPTKGFPNYDGYPIVPGWGASTFEMSPGVFGGTSYSYPMGSRGFLVGTWGSTDTRFTYADTITWTKGRHSFKGGAEYRQSKSDSDLNGSGIGTLAWPFIRGGQLASYTPAQGIGTNWTGLAGTDQAAAAATGNYAGAYELMNSMAGSIGSIAEYYFINSSTQKVWNDATKGELTRYIPMKGNELSLFVKDDWKLSSSLTLNLGLRYEYYGIPWLENGMTSAVTGGAMNAFGGSKGDFTTWFPANPVYDKSVLTTTEFVGPNSPNSGRTFMNKDMNNLGPAVGFAWQLPWFGKGKTTLRGGYQLSYLQMSQYDPNGTFGSAIANPPGSVWNYTYAGDSSHRYMDYAGLSQLIPNAQFNPAIQPLATRDWTDRSQGLTVIDENLKAPYIQSLNMSITRNIGSSLTVDFRYIGTLSRKQITAINLNTVNFIDNGLGAALINARAGLEDPLLNSLIPPNSLVNGVASGAQQLRQWSTTSTNMAIGNFSAIASTLATTNGRLTVPAGTLGGVLRAGGAAENFIYKNPQFASVNFYGNNNHSNYHSLQVQVTMRPKRGLNFMNTYTWSKNLGMNGTTDWRDRQQDYGLLSSNRPHVINSQGSYILPFGTNGFLFRDASKLTKKIVEGWQLSWIASYSSGLPGGVSLSGSGTSLWGGTSVDLVRPELFDKAGGHVQWAPGAYSGAYYGTLYTSVNDPQCSSGAVQGNVATVGSLAWTCANNMKALALASDPTVIVFQRALPGVRGNFQPNQLTGPGRWSLDTAIGKSVEFMEGKTITFRVDAQNILNHPTPSGTQVGSYNSRNYSPSLPNFAVGPFQNPFGYLASKAGHRVFVAKIRLSF